MRSAKHAKITSLLRRIALSISRAPDSEDPPALYDITLEQAAFVVSCSFDRDLACGVFIVSPDISIDLRRGRSRGLQCRLID